MSHLPYNPQNALLFFIGNVILRGYGRGIGSYDKLKQKHFGFKSFLRSKKLSKFIRTMSGMLCIPS